MNETSKIYVEHGDRFGYEGVRLMNKATPIISLCVSFTMLYIEVILNLIQGRIQIYSIVTNYELFIAELQKNGIKERP